MSMRFAARLIITALGAVVGVVLGGLLGSFGLFYLCSLFDWITDAQPGNQMIGGTWILMIVTVPLGAFYLGTAGGTIAWKSFDESKSEDRSEPRDHEERESVPDETWQ
jgi:hypothetical protein